MIQLVAFVCLIQTDRSTEKTLRTMNECRQLSVSAHEILFGKAPKFISEELRKSKIDHCFEFRTEFITYQCDAVTGQLISVRRWPTKEQERISRNVKAKPRIPNVIEAQKKARAYLRLLGLPPHAALEYSVVYGPRMPDRGDEVEPGGYSFKFGLKANGHKFRKEWSHWFCTVDWHDGYPNVAAAMPTAKPVASTQNLTRPQAVAIARQNYPRLLAEKKPQPKPRRNANIRTMLKYVVPNAEYGGQVKAPVNRIFEARLAWIIIIGPDEVWVDAGDGKLLGGWMRGFLDSHTEYYKDGRWTPNDY